jgi:hypothetical protein
MLLAQTEMICLTISTLPQEKEWLFFYTHLKIDWKCKNNTKKFHSDEEFKQIEWEIEYPELLFKHFLITI